jgi:CubicO group peptidase (beta-lactamase class C family)
MSAKGQRIGLLLFMGGAATACGSPSARGSGDAGTPDFGDSGTPGHTHADAGGSTVDSGHARDAGSIEDARPLRDGTSGGDVTSTETTDAVAQDDAAGGSCQATGMAGAAYQPIDSAVLTFLQAQGVKNAQFAMSENGTTLISRAYTCPGAIGAPTTTTTAFRLASNSKAWTSAAIDSLIQKGTISRSTLAFQQLGLTTPLPSNATVDPRVLTITVGNLIDHESGWDDTMSPYFDPSHRMRDIALALGLSQEITQAEMVQYMLGQPLQEAPGTTYAYCNFCYDVLGMIVANASGMSFGDYVTQEIAAPIGVDNLLVSPTLEPRLPGEVSHYFSPNTGLSAVDVTSTALVPAPNGGDGCVREVGAPAAGLATSAESMLKLMDHYLIWGVGPPAGAGYDWARSGSDEGTSTWAEQRADLKYWSFVINTRDFTSSTAFTDFTTQVDTLLNSLP